LLFPIIGLSELVLEDLEKNSREYKNILEIFKAGMRGSELVKQILAFRYQSEYTMLPTCIQNIIKEVLKLSRSTIPSYIEIIQDIQFDCDLVIADSIQIHQVITNLIINAYHAVEEANGDKITVRLKEVYLEKIDLDDTSLEPHFIALNIIGHSLKSKCLARFFYLLNCFYHFITK